MVQKENENLIFDDPLKQAKWDKYLGKYAAKVESSAKSFINQKLQEVSADLLENE